MKIVKYKKSTKGRYIVYFDNDVEKYIYEEVILKYDLLLKKNIDDKLFVLINDYNRECEVYYTALDLIKNRARSIYDLKCVLLNKFDDTNLIELAIGKLIKQGYLNDSNYAKSYIYTQMVTTNKGPLKIENELSNKRIDSDIIANELKVYSNSSQISKIKKIVDKSIKSNHSKGGSVLKRKIVNNLLNLGYDYSLIQNVVNEYSFVNNDVIAKKEYEKLYKRYSKKYDGVELERILKEKMYLKGLTYEKED